MKTGRKPLFGAAMSGAERQRRYYRAHEGAEVERWRKKYQRWCDEVNGSSCRSAPIERRFEPIRQG